MIKRLNKFIYLLCRSKYATISLFVISLSEAIFFPIPPDILLMPLIIIRKDKFIKYALYCTLGSVIGGCIGYNIGNHLWWNDDNYTYFANYLIMNTPLFSETLFLKIQNYFDEYGFLIIFTAGFTPIPYKIFSISAGINNISIYMFIFASIISRGCRFFLISILLYHYGERVKILIEKYFNKITILLMIIILSIYYFFIK